jgi:hypothetical protein
MAQKRKTKTPPPLNTLDDGSVVDVSDIDESLTERAKRFVFFYTFPGTDGYMNKTRAAVRAGYAKKNAVSSGYKLCKSPVIKKEIERLSGAYVSEGIDTAYRKYINTLETRAFFDPADFISGAAFKKIEEIAPEKRVCLEQPIIDMKEGTIVGYTFGSRRAAMAEIKDAYEKGHPGGTGDDGFDEEETIRIMQRVSETAVMIERRKKGEEMRKVMIEKGHIQESLKSITEL